MAEVTGNTTLDVYNFILEWATKHKGNTPSQRQIATALGCVQTTALYHIHKLIDHGVLSYVDGELCIERSTFTLDNNALDLMPKQAGPDVIAMQYIPKVINSDDPGLWDELGIVMGDVADEEFMYATYPAGWHYELLTDNGSHSNYLLHDNDDKIRAVLRHYKEPYRADITFIG